MVRLGVGNTGRCRNSHLHRSRGPSLGEFSEDGDSSSLSVPGPEPWPYCDMPLDMAHFPTVVTLGCLEFAVFGQVTGAITAITGRRCPFANNHDAGTCKFGALLLTCLQLLDIFVGNLGGLAQVESLLECQVWFCRRRFCRWLSWTRHTSRSRNMSSSGAAKLQCSDGQRSSATNLAKVSPSRCVRLLKVKH